MRPSTMLWIGGAVLLSAGFYYVTRDLMEDHEIGLGTLVVGLTLTAAGAFTFLKGFDRKRTRK